ncbi:MAG: hypothetical protein ACI9UK_000030 [Candidatus Krumholzibacteriia bacterium]|jgi:hypothetical protein
MKKFLKVFGATLLAISMFGFAAQAATIVIVNLDGPGEGFNDATPVAAVGGNPGLTIGEQRLNLFTYAADIWGGLLDSDVTIRIQAKFDPLSCDADGGVLGSAGAIVVNRDFAGAEEVSTWYHGALGNKQAGFDLDPTFNDINTTFNASVDNNNNCLNGTNWYYGFDGNAGNDIALLPVLLHEFGHGLGFSTFVNGSSGAEFNGFPDVYSRHILDNSSGLHWDEMNDAQRQASAVNDGNVVWDGDGVTAAAPSFLSGPPVLTINSPGTLPASMAAGSASFGPALDIAGITGNLVLVEDGVGVGSDGCSALTNGAQVNGNIALIDRGSCSFVLKAQGAEAAGAIAVIIVNNVVAGTPPPLGGADPGLTIPTISVTLADGNLLKAELGGGVNVTLQLDASVLAGTDNQGRVKLFSPNPLQPGSSTSHFDVSANPSLLMEPGITPGLNDEVDLTLAHFGDIGWFQPFVSAVDDIPATRSELGNAYPNPFNPSTQISFRVANAGPVRLAIHDAAGRLIRTLVNESISDGEYTVAWDGNDRAGRRAGSGVYFYRLELDGYSETKKMVMLK